MKQPCSVTLFILLGFSVILSACAEPPPGAKNETSKPNSDFSSIWGEPHYHRPSVCCDTQPSYTPTGDAMTVIFQNSDGALRLPLSDEALSNSKIFSFEIPIKLDTSVSKYALLTADLRFNVSKPVGTSVRLLINVGNTLKVLELDKTITTNDNQVLSMLVPMPAKLPEKLPITILVFAERSSKAEEILLQLDSLDLCMSNRNSKVCVQPAKDTASKPK